MNEIIKAMEERRSIRKFQPTMPTKDDLAQIVKPGCMRPAVWAGSPLSSWR